ncbi:hypothetical protein [Trinickia sp. EG282A]|uniref:hypothetical protein n=1 Tax=Trinickia sp. EG282A TaxID=3237013 RepID=UPI0034D2AC55
MTGNVSQIAQVNVSTFYASLGEDAKAQLAKYMASGDSGSQGDDSPQLTAGFVRLLKFAKPGIGEAQVQKQVASFHSHIATEFASKDDSIALRNNDSPMGRGILTMSQMMALLNYVANALMDDIDAEQNVARHAQDMSNDVGAVIGDITDATTTKTLPADVIKYLQDNGINVDGVDIKGSLNKGQLQLVKNAIDSRQTQASNFVQTSQLKIQQVMQTYNIATQMVNSLLSMGAEMNKSIASSIR